MSKQTREILEDVWHDGQGHSPKGLVKSVDEAEAALDALIQAERLKTGISIIRAEHQLLFNKLPIGDVDAWELLKMLKSHLTMLSERITADEAQLQYKRGEEYGI
mgnify:CR=1 FL=1